jgi:hypothetical protein
MPLKPTLVCTTPYGVFRRGTWRVYTHVIVSVHPEGTSEALAWSGNGYLAEDVARYWRRELPTARVEVFPVDPKEEIHVS